MTISPLAVFLSIPLALLSGTALAQGELTGDTRLACEAVLCLSSSTQPAQCTPALLRYFGIRHKKFSDTLRARTNFLNLCPVSNQTPEMASLVSAITQGAGRCDANSLNATLRIWGQFNETGEIYISNQLPDYCASYVSHSYTDFNTSGALPRFVGEPHRRGYWTEARNYEQALAQYTERIKREDEASLQGQW